MGNLPSFEAKLAQFHKGQPVRHVGMGAGVVLRNDGDAVYVQYEATNRKGHRIGVYDEAWFRLYPEALSHALIGTPTKSRFQALVAEITEENRHSEVATGLAVGNEIVTPDSQP